MIKIVFFNIRSYINVYQNGTNFDPKWSKIDPVSLRYGHPANVWISTHPTSGCVSRHPANVGLEQASLLQGFLTLLIWISKECYKKREEQSHEMIMWISDLQTSKYNLHTRMRWLQERHLTVWSNSLRDSQIGHVQPECWKVGVGYRVIDSAVLKSVMPCWNWSAVPDGPLLLVQVRVCVCVW